MTTTPATTTTPTPAKPKPLEPVWLAHLVGLVLIAVPIVLAVWQPGHSFHTATAQAAIVVAGVAAAGILHIVHLVTINGLTKAGLLRTVHEEAAWLHANWADISGAISTARNLAGSIDPALLARTEAAVSSLQSQVSSLSASDTAAVESVVRRLVIPGVLVPAASTTPTSEPTPTAPGATPATAA